MLPFGKPKPGFEERFYEIFKIIQGSEKLKISFAEKLKGKKESSKDEPLQEWFENQIPIYETIKAPRVGRDKEANEWVKQKYEESDKSIPESDFIKEYDGFYVVDLAKELDGISEYNSFGEDKNVFSAHAICFDLIGEDLVKEFWESKLAGATLDYGNRLMAVADKIANDKGLQYLKEQRMPPDTDEDSIESKLHIVFSFAKWLIFYGKNGHGYEACITNEMTDVQQLEWKKIEAEIFSAFSNVKLEDGIGYHEANAKDDYYKPTDLEYIKEKNKDERNDWTKLLIEFDDVDLQNWRYCFMDAKGLLFHLPFLMVRRNDIIDWILYCYISAVHKKRWVGDCEIKTVSLMTKEQKHCVFLFYNFSSKIDPDDFWRGCQNSELFVYKELQIENFNFMKFIKETFCQK